MIKIEFLSDRSIALEMPLTIYPQSLAQHVRVKTQNPYGMQVNTKNECFSEQMYIEWQIRYDAHENQEQELDKILNLMWQNGLLIEEDIREMLEYIRLSQEPYIEQDLKNCMQLPRGNSPCDNVLIIHKYPTFGFQYALPFLIEVSYEKRGYAQGMQPMLYVCIPITELRDRNLLGRVAQSKECAIFIINNSNKHLMLEICKIFGRLNEQYQQDMLQLLGSFLPQQTQ